MDVLVKFAIALAILSLVKNSEKIVNSFGIRTIANGDTVKEYAKGARTAGAMILGNALVQGMKRQAGLRAWGELSHGVTNTFSKFTGRNSLATKAARVMDADIVPNNKINMGKSIGKWNTKTQQYDPKETLSRRDTMALNNVNKALKTNGRVKMTDLNRVVPLSQIDNKSYGLYAQATEVNGQKAFAYEGMDVSKYGNHESTPKKYLATLEPGVFETGDNVSFRGKDSGYVIAQSQDNAITSDGSKIYRLEEKNLNNLPFEEQEDTRMSKEFFDNDLRSESFVHTEDLRAYENKVFNQGAKESIDNAYKRQDEFFEDMQNNERSRDAAARREQEEEFFSDKKQSADDFKDVHPEEEEDI